MVAFALPWVVAAVCQANEPKPVPRPRFPSVVVLADDLGIGDVGATNPACRIATPNTSDVRPRTESPGRAFAEGGLHADALDVALASS